jgi:hypothetical protein
VLYLKSIRKIDFSLKEGFFSFGKVGLNEAGSGLSRRRPLCVSKLLIIKLVSGNINLFLAQDLKNRLYAPFGPIT